MIKTSSFGNSLSRSTTLFQLVGLQYFSLDSDSFHDGFHQRTKISKKHKFSFVVNASLLSFQFFGIWYAIQLEKKVQQTESVNTGLTIQFIVYVLMTLVAEIVIINAFRATEGVKNIFCNFEKISKIFENELNTKLDYVCFARSFEKKLLAMALTFLGLTVLILAFIFYHNQSNIFIWALMSIYPYFIAEVLFCYFLFFILLVNENLNYVKRVLAKLHTATHDSPIMSFRVISIQATKIKKCEELFNTIVKLKRIYISLCETTEIINKLFGLPIMIELIIFVLGNISAGYKVYLAILGDIPIARVGSKISFLLLNIFIITFDYFQFQSTRWSSHLFFSAWL